MGENASSINKSFSEVSRDKRLLCTKNSRNNDTSRIGNSPSFQWLANNKAKICLTSLIVVIITPAMINANIEEYLKEIEEVKPSGQA
jgi:hypothetical protein